MKRCDKMVEAGRRQFLRGGIVAAAALPVASIGFVLALVLLLDRLGSRLPAGTLPWRS